MSLLALRAGIRDTLANSIDLLRGAYTHGGNLDISEVMRTAITAPCIVVACLGVGSTTLRGGVTHATAQWGVYVVCRGSSQEPRDVQALMLTELILGQVHANDWNAANVSGPRDVRADNLFSETVDSQGTALWRVTWDQGVDLTRDASSLTPFLGTTTTWNTADSTSHPDATDFIQVQGDFS